MSSKVIEIGANAFAYCPILTSIHLADSQQAFHLPDTLTRIGHGAFNNCTSLTSIILPDSVTHIEYQAFPDSATRITLPESLLFLSPGVFLYSENVDIIYQRTTTQWRAIVKIAPSHTTFGEKEYNVTCTDGTAVFSTVSE